MTEAAEPDPLAALGLSDMGLRLQRFLYGPGMQKHERMRALHAASNRLPPADLAVLFAECWTGSESIFRDLEPIAEMLSQMRRMGAVDRMMTSPDLARLERLRRRKAVQLYRGAMIDGAFGPSWTTSIERARWFAGYNAMNGQAVVFTASFLPGDLLAFFSSRNESEVLIDVTSNTAQRAIAAASTHIWQCAPASTLRWKVQAFGEMCLVPPEQLAEVWWSHPKTLDELAQEGGASARYGALASTADEFGLTEKAAKLRAYGDAVAAELERIALSSTEK